MKLVILAMGLGTRLSEETDARPNREAIKRMKKEQRKVFLEDLLASTSPEYLESIKEARRNYKAGRVTTHKEVFGR